MRIPEIYDVVFMISFRFCILMLFTALLGNYSSGPLQFSEDLALVSESGPFPLTPLYLVHC